MFHSFKCHDISVRELDFNNEVDMSHVELSVGWLRLAGSLKS